MKKEVTQTSITKVNPSDFGIDPKEEKNLIGNLPQIKKERDAFLSQYNQILKMDLDNPETAEQAKTLRILIVKNRTQGIVPWHKKSKDYFLNGGRFIDSIKNVEIEVNERMERTLKEIEDYAEKKEKERLDAIYNERYEIIKDYIQFVPSGVDLKYIDVLEFKNVLKAAKLMHKADLEEKEEARKEEEKKESLRKIGESRRKLLLDYWYLMSDVERKVNFSVQSEKDFKGFLQTLKNIKETEDKKIKAQQAENEKLRKQNEALAQKEKERVAKEQLEAKQARELKAQQEALKKEPVKEQMTVWINSFSINKIDESKLTQHQIDICRNIENKFGSYKKWALMEIEKL